MLVAVTTVDDRERMREIIDGYDTAMCRRIAVSGPLGSSSSFGCCDGGKCV